METAITARLYFVLFSGAANSNNKLSPILPLQPATTTTPVFCPLRLESPQPASSFPSPLFVSLCASSGLRALRSSFEFRAFRLPYVPRMTSVSEFESFAEIHPGFTSPGRLSFVVAQGSVTLEVIEYLRSPTDTTWKRTSRKLFDKYPKKFKLKIENCLA